MSLIQKILSKLCVDKIGLCGKDKLDDFRFAAIAGNIELFKALLEIDPISVKDIKTVKNSLFLVSQPEVLQFVNNLIREG